MKWPEKLPEDPAKLKLLTREYIIKRCRAWEKIVDENKLERVR